MCGRLLGFKLKVTEKLGTHNPPACCCSHSIHSLPIDQAPRPKALSSYNLSSFSLKTILIIGRNQKRNRKITMAEATHDDSVNLDDLDLDGDLQRLSAAAMSALDSLTNEVDAIEGKSKPSKPQAQSVYLDDPLQSGGYETDSSDVDPHPVQSQSSIKHIDDIQFSDDEDEDDDMSYDASLDGSIAGELDALRSVAQEIERELQDQDGQTMQKAIERLENSDNPKHHFLTSDDHEIIRNALLEEIKKYEPKNAWERFMKRYQLEGTSEQDKTYALATICTLIWSIVFRLFYKVKFGEL
jgi:hypothetical protein